MRKLQNFGEEYALETFVDKLPEREAFIEARAELLEDHRNGKFDELPAMKSVKEMQQQTGENTRYLDHGLRVMQMPHIDTHDAEQVRIRSIEYLQMCAEDDYKPSVAEFAMALGTDRLNLLNWMNGNSRSAEVKSIIAQVHALITSQMESWMQNGKINPVAGIFLMRNNMGYTNDETVTIRAEKPEMTEKRDLIAEARMLPGIEDKKI